MDKKAKSNAHVAFLESIPSQLRTAYLGMKQKMNAKLPTHAARDPDKDLQHVVDGGAFEYVPFEKLCRNVFEPEECYLRLDATGCKLILEMVASEELLEFPLFGMSRPSSQFDIVNKKNRNTDHAHVLCIDVMSDDGSGSQTVRPMHFLCSESAVVLTWRNGLKVALVNSAKLSRETYESGSSFLWRAWLTVPAPDVSLYHHLMDKLPDAPQLADNPVEYGPITAAESTLALPELNPFLSQLSPQSRVLNMSSVSTSPTGAIFDKLLYPDSKAKGETFSFFELSGSRNLKDMRRLQLLQEAGIKLESDVTFTTACAAELWDDAYGLSANPRISPFDGILADANTALHFLCNQDPNSAASSLGKGSIYEKLLRIVLEKGGVQMINTANRDGLTPLMVAVSRSNNVLVQLLVSLSADIFAVDAMGNTCFHYAVCFNNPDVLATLCSNIHQVKLRRASSYQLPQQRSKALSRFGKIQASIMFLKAVKASTAGGSSDKPEVDFASFARAISLPNSNGNTCLHLAVARRNTEVLSKFLDFLSEFGLSSRLLCVADHNGETPLHFACRQGSIEDIIVLLLHGARVGVEADSGATAEDMLRQCVSKHSERKDVMQLLIMLGPVLQKENREYELFLEQQQGSLTIFNTQVEFCQVLSKKRRIGIGLPPVFELITLMPSLVSYCPSLIASSDWIMGLVRDGDAGELIKQVENIGETVDSFIGMTDPDGNTLLHKAVEYRHLDIALIFLESGIDAAKTNLFGISSVHMAASQGLPDFYFSIMSSLLNFDFVFKGRHNIMDLAAAGGSLHILNSLHSLGGAFADDLGNSCGVLESAVQHQQFATSMYAACQVPFSSRSSAMLLEIKDFILKLEDRKSNWSILIEASTEIDFRTGLQAKVKEANGLMVAQSLASRDSSALWRHLSDDHWQSLAKWQSQDEHRHSLVHIAVINRQYEALNTMFLNGHSPSSFDGKGSPPIHYACFRGDWKLAAVLRVLYLVPFRPAQTQSNNSIVDDSLFLASIDSNHEHVLMTLLLLNAPLSNAACELVIEEGQSSTRGVPSPVSKAFQLKNHYLFHLLVQGCFYHSIVVCNGTFERIEIQLKRFFVFDVELETKLETASILHQVAVTMDSVLNSRGLGGVPVTAVASIISETLPETADVVLRDNLAVANLAESSNAEAPTAFANTQDGPCVDTLSADNCIVHVEEPRSNSAAGAFLHHIDASSATSEQASSPVICGRESPMLPLEDKPAPETSDAQTGAVDDTIKIQSFSTHTVQLELPLSSAQNETPLLQADAASALARVPDIGTSIAESQPSFPMNTVGNEQGANANVVESVSSNIRILESNPSSCASPEDGHYVVKESVTLTFDKFELEIDAEYRNMEPVAQFDVQDVLPAVRVEDRIGHEFLNACKVGLQDVLISLVGCFSIDSIFGCAVIAQGHPMQLAVLSRSLLTVQALFKWKPALILDVDQDGCTPLHVASRINFHVALSMFLSSNIMGAGKANQVDREGHSCLTLAVQQGAVECVELLVKTETDALSAPSAFVPCALELSLTSSFHSSHIFRRLFNLCSEQTIHSFRSSHDNGLLQVAVKHQRMHSVGTILQRMGEGFAQMRDATGRTAVEIAAASHNKTLFNLLTQQSQEHEYSQAPPMQHDAPLPASEDYFDDLNLSKTYLLRSFPAGKQVTSTLIDQINSCVIGGIKGSGMLQLFQKMVASGNSHLLGKQIFVLGPQTQCTCLHLAAGVNSVTSIQFVLDNCSRSRQFLDLHNSSGMTACAVALIAGYTNCAKLLLHQGSRIVSENVSGASQDSMLQKTCNLLHICAKHCHDSLMMEQLLDVSCSSHILALNDSKNSLLHICAHVSNIHAYNAIISKAPYAIAILVNHRDDLGNTALHVCASNAGGLPLAHALIQGGSYTHLRNYDGDLPHEIARFMGNMDIAQLTRTFKSEELVSRADFRLQCDEYASKVIDCISHDKIAELTNMCKSPLWIGSWLSVDFLSSELCAEKVAGIHMATSLSHAGFCGISCPTLVGNVLGIMLKTRRASITQSLDKLFPGCTDLVISSFLVNNFPSFAIQIAREKALEISTFAWVVKYWTHLSVCDSTRSNALAVACQTQNVGFLNALIQHIEAMVSQANVNDNQLFSCLKCEIAKALSSRNDSGQTCLDIASSTAVASHVMKIISLISFNFPLRSAASSQMDVLDVIPQRHLSLISFGMIEVLFQEPDFDISTAQKSRDRFGRCLIANACIAGHVASVSALLEKGFSHSVIDFEGLGILHHAVFHHRNDVVYFITQRFPQKLLELNSQGSCILHLAIQNGSDSECLSTLKLLETTMNSDAFVGLCLHSDDAKCTVVEESFFKGKYNSGLLIIQKLLLKCGRLSANPIHVLDQFVTNYLRSTFKLISEFNWLMVRISSAAYTKNSLSSFLKIFCSEPQSPVEHDDTLQPQNFDLASSSLQVLISDLKFSSFFSGKWICEDETFSQHYLVPDDTLSRGSLGQIFASVYDNPAFSNFVRPSVSEALMTHSLRLNWILQDGVSPSDCEQVLTIQSKLIEHFLVLERLSSVFYSKIQTYCHNEYVQIHRVSSLQHNVACEPLPMAPIQDSSWHTIDLQKLNGIGIYPPISSDVPEAIELFTMAEANRIDDIVSFMWKSTKHLTLSLDRHKNTLAHAVAFYCNEQDVLRLIKAGLKVDVRNDSGQMPFHFSCLAGRFEVAKACFQSLSSTALPVDSYGHSILHFAALSMNENCLSNVQAACKIPIPWDLTTTSRRQTALDVALEMEVDPKHPVCTLLARGEAMAVACKSKLVSVQFALQSCLITCCKLDLNLKAASCVHAGADIRKCFSVQSDNGEQHFWNAIDTCAAYNSLAAIKSIFDNVESSTWLEAINHSNDNRQQNQQPASVWVACKHKSLSSLKFLLENGSNLMIENDSGLNIFSFCVELRCNDSLLELLQFCSANFTDAFLKRIILAPDKTGQNCIEHAIQARHPKTIGTLRDFLLRNKICEEAGTILLGHQYLELVCHSRPNSDFDAFASLICIVEVLQFFNTDVAHALFQSYQDNHHPLQCCNSNGCHNSAVLLFIVHVLAGVGFDGNMLSATDIDQQIDQSSILSGSGPSLVWNSMQLIERILLAFKGTDFSTQRYLSVQLGLFVVKLDDRCIHSFVKLLLSKKIPTFENLVPFLEDFFVRASSAFKELCVSEVSKHVIASIANLSEIQSALVHAIYRGDSPAFHGIILSYPNIHLDPRNSDIFHNQCYVAAIQGDQEHVLEDLAQKGFRYLQRVEEESLLMLASRLGRSKIVRGLSQRPHLELDPNYSTADGVCALHLACARNFSETLRSLTTHFPKINVRALNSQGESAISLCVKHGHISAIETLIDCVGVPVFLSVLNASKQNVFHLAAATEKPAIFQAALAMSLKSLNQTHVFGGNSPSCDLLKSLVAWSKDDSQCAENSQTLIHALCARDFNGDTPAHICVRFRSVASLAILLTVCPIACLLPNRSGLAPFHLSVSRGLFSVDVFRMLASVAKSLGQWIFDSESKQQLVQEDYLAHASLMAALCHFEDADGMTVWDIAFSDNTDAQSFIAKFISLCRLKNPYKPQIVRLFETSALKSLLISRSSAPPPSHSQRSRGLGSIFLASIGFLQNILHRSKLNRWYGKQLRKQIDEINRSVASSRLLQRSWRHHIAVKKFRAARFTNNCYICIQCSIRSLFSRRTFILRKNLLQQLKRIDRARSVWSAYQRFAKTKQSVETIKARVQSHAEHLKRRSVSGALQLQASVLSHHLFLLRKAYSKRLTVLLKAKAASTLQRVYRGREGRRLFHSLKKLSEYENFLPLPSGRAIHVSKYMILRFIRRMQCAVRFLLAKRQFTVRYFFKNGLKACCLIQRVWLNHFARVQLRRKRSKRDEMKLSVAASKIQKHVRAKFCRVLFRHNVEPFRYVRCSLTLQCAFRCRSAIRLFRSRVDSAVFHAQRLRQVRDLRVFIENESLKSKRGRVEYQLLSLKSKAATVIASLIRGVIIRCRKVLASKKLERQSRSAACNNLCSAQNIQLVWRRHCAMQKMRSLGWTFGQKAKRLVAVKRMVSYLKARVACRVCSLLRRLRAVLKLQNIWRVHQSTQVCLKLRSIFWARHVQQKSSKIQAVFKAHMIRLSFVLLKSSWPQMREQRMAKKIFRQLFSNFQSSKFHKVVMQTLADHKCMCSLKIQCAFRAKIARNVLRLIVCSHNMEMIENKTRKLQKFWRRCSQEKRFSSKIPWMLFPWPSGDIRLESSSWSVSYAYDARLEMFMQSSQFDDYDSSLSAACQFGMRRLQEVPADAAFALQSLIRFAASMCETALYHGNTHVAFSLASRAAKLIGTEGTKFVLSCRTEFSAWVLDTLAHVFFTRGMFSHALSLLNEAVVAGGLRSSPDNNMLAILHFHKGLIYQEMGNSASARANLLHACQLFHQQVDTSYSLHLAAAHLALSSVMFSACNFEDSAVHCCSGKEIISRISTNAVDGNFFPPSMCWRPVGFLRILRRIATASHRFIQRALLKDERNKLGHNGRVFGRSNKSRMRRTLNQFYIFPSGMESWTRWSSQSIGAYGILPKKPPAFLVGKSHNRGIKWIEFDDQAYSVNGSSEFQAFVPSGEDKQSTEATSGIDHDGGVENILRTRFLSIQSGPALIHPWLLFNGSNSSKTEFQDYQFLLSSCLDVSASSPSQQRWLKLLQSCSPDEQLPSFVKALVFHAPSPGAKVETDLATSAKVFSASPKPAPRKDIVACLNRAMNSLLYRAYSLAQSFVDGKCVATDCKEPLQLLKDMIDGNMNSLKHIITKEWKYIILLCEAVLLALTSDYSEAFNCCMRAHDSLQKAELLEGLEFTLAGLSSCNAAYCLWNFQKSAVAEAQTRTFSALSEMLSVDVKMTARTSAAVSSLATYMLHNLAHMTIQSGEYLRSFMAWGEAIKIVELLSERAGESIQEWVLSLASSDSGILNASTASIGTAISTWLSIKELISSSESKISTGIQGIRDLKKSHHRTPKRHKMEMLHVPDEQPHRFAHSSEVVHQTLPEELLLGLFGSGVNRVRAAGLPQQSLKSLYSGNNE